MSLSGVIHYYLGGTMAGGKSAALGEFGPVMASPRTGHIYTAFDHLGAQEGAKAEQAVMNIRIIRPIFSRWAGRVSMSRTQQTRNAGNAAYLSLIHISE